MFFEMLFATPTAPLLLRCFLGLKQALVSYPICGKRFEPGIDLFRAKEENKPSKHPTISLVGLTYSFTWVALYIYINIYIYLNTPIYIHMHVRTREAACLLMSPWGER
jgi:hypothetical protein